MNKEREPASCSKALIKLTCDFDHTTPVSVFKHKSCSWPNQIWSWGDGWLHFRETTPLRDPGSPRITNGFLIIFHHPISCLSLILAMIPETSCELHLNLCDQSALRSSRSHSLWQLPTPCVYTRPARHPGVRRRAHAFSVLTVCCLAHTFACEKLPNQCL